MKKDKMSNEEKIKFLEKRIEELKAEELQKKISEISHRASQMINAILGNIKGGEI